MLEKENNKGTLQMVAKRDGHIPLGHKPITRGHKPTQTQPVAESKPPVTPGFSTKTKPQANPTKSPPKS